jgi:hypothetical protein
MHEGGLGRQQKRAECVLPTPKRQQAKPCTRNISPPSPYQVMTKTRKTRAAIAAKSAARFNDWMIPLDTIPVILFFMLVTYFVYVVAA